MNKEKTISIRDIKNLRPQPRVKNMDEEIAYSVEQGKKQAVNFFTSINDRYYQNTAVALELIKWYFYEMPLNTSPLKDGIKAMPLLDGVFGVNNTPLKYEGLNESEAYHFGFCEGLRREIIQHSEIYKYKL